MEVILLVAYVAIAAFFALTAILDRKTVPGGLRLFLAIAAWPVSILIVLVVVASVIAHSTGTGERHYSSA